MSLTQKHEPPNWRTADFEKSQPWSKNAGLVPIADCSESEPSEPLATGLTFLQDFSLEHSLHGVRITAIEIAGIF